MIQVIPSIAIRKGQVVKMRKGDPTSEKVYGENPLDLVKRFEDHGIEVIHLVDLDGAERGAPVNYHIIEQIAGYTSLKIDFTGGISTDGDISKAYEAGAHYITASSIAISNPELFASWIVSYGREKITLGADVTDISTKKLLFRGWQKKSELTLFEHLYFFLFAWTEVCEVNRCIARWRAGRPGFLLLSGNSGELSGSLCACQRWCSGDRRHQKAE
ncbi:HisA/HisF-related TIM barrel protein [Oscillatoria amoena NRMC-F 0135]|nr:HisA/HisF-related TIM barrel protein [Oscillatoria amoena NRMC-F 0135]